jgi:hypothetical protein
VSKSLCTYGLVFSLLLLPVSIIGRTWPLATILTIQAIIFLFLLRRAACKD